MRASWCWRAAETTLSDTPTLQAPPPVWSPDPLLGARRAQVPQFLRTQWDEATARGFGPWRVAAAADPGAGQTLSAFSNADPTAQVEQTRAEAPQADVADNPGGGGGGNTVTLLKALLQAGAQRVVLGVFTDPALAAEATALGVGAQWVARLNREGRQAFAEAFEYPATVLALSDGEFVGERGMTRGIAQRMGPSALLQLGGIKLAVVSLRQQLIDPGQLKALGEDLSQAAVLVAKSRGHFRAAFDDFAPPERILEVDDTGSTLGEHHQVA